jgi:hypothetical protein
MSIGIDELIEQKVREIVREELEPIRHLLLNAGVEPDTPEPDELVGADEVAVMLGEDVSTDAAKRTALQRVYYLARADSLPCVRLSARRVRFDPRAVKRWIAGGGTRPATKKDIEL